MQGLVGDTHHDTEEHPQCIQPLHTALSLFLRLGWQIQNKQGHDPVDRLDRVPSDRIWQLRRHVTISTIESEGTPSLCGAIGRRPLTVEITLKVLSATSSWVM